MPHPNDTPIDQAGKPAPWTYERFLATGDLAGCPLAPEAVDKLRGIAEKRAQIAAVRATREAGSTLPPSAEQLLADAEERLAREQREETDEAAWAVALKRNGKGRVGRVRTVDGAIIMRAQTAAEADANGERVAAIEDRAMRNQVAKEATLDGVVHPDKAAVRAILDRYPGAWIRLYELRDALVSGEEGALLGKA